MAMRRLNDVTPKEWDEVIALLMEQEGAKCATDETNALLHPQQETKQNSQPALK